LTSMPILQKKRTLRDGMIITVIASVLFLAAPSNGFCGGDSQLTSVIVPINMAFPLLPTIAVLDSQPGTCSSLIIISFGIDGIAGAIRVSARV